MNKRKWEGIDGYTEYEKIDYDAYDYRKTQQLQDLKKCLKIVNNYKVWQDFWHNMTLEIADLYYENGICCECDADEHKIYYTREVV